MKILTVLSVFLIASISSASPSSYFVPNMGQWEGDFLYRCDVGNASYFVTSTGLTISIIEVKAEIGKRKAENPLIASSRGGTSSFIPHPSSFLRGHALMLRFVGGNTQAEIEGENKLVSYSNYFFGRDSSQWKSRVPNYGKVIVKEVWPGIDVEYRAHPQGVETSFRIAPNADFSQIMIEYDGLDAPLYTDGQGNLILTTSLGELKEQAPYAYQQDGRIQRSIPVTYHLLSPNRYGFVVNEYDKTKDLVIDPLVYSTFIAGSFRDEVNDMTKDSLGNKIIGGGTYRTDFPTTPGAFQETLEFPGSGYVMKFSPDADTLIFSTYISGGGVGGGNVRVRSDGSIYYVMCAFENWPCTPNAFDTSYTGRYGDIGIVLLSPDGSTLLYGTYLGGNDQENVRGGAEVDSLGRLYVFGETFSSDFPITPDALYPNFYPNFSLYLSIIDPPSPSIVYSTFYGTRYPCLAMDQVVVAPKWLWIVVVDHAGDLPTTEDALIPEYQGWETSYFALLDLDTGEIIYASYLGAPHEDYQSCELQQVLIADSNQLWLVGHTTLTNLPMPPGGFQSTLQSVDGFILKLQLPNQLLCGTFLGGSDEDAGFHGFIEPTGSIVVTGETMSSDFPITPDAFDTTHFESEFNTDIVLCRLSNNLTTLQYGTYIGGNSEGEWVESIVYDGSSGIWLGGVTYSYDFPITPDAMFQEESFGYMLRMDLSEQSIHEPHSSALPDKFTLSIYPNPFNPITTLSFTLPRPSPVELNVFNILGQMVYQTDLGKLPAGEHHRLFDASDLPSGIYLAQVSASGMTRVQKMAVIK